MVTTIDNDNKQHRSEESTGDNIRHSNDETSNQNSDDETRKAIRLPVLKYGYRTVPCSWGELVDIVLNQKDIAKLSRSEEQQYSYELYKQKLLVEWNTMADYVLFTKFPNVFTKVKDSSNDSSQPRRWKVDPPVESITTTHMALVKNDFPYYMEDDIEHWVLWKLGGDSISDLDFENAKEDLCRNHNMHGKDIIHWVNPIDLKSIPNIEHAHFLGRIK